MHTPSISFINALFLISSLVFSISVGPVLYPFSPPYWAVQMPGREKSSKWKHKEDEGGKKDAEKEETRSREQESSMNQTINEWKLRAIPKILIMSLFILGLLRLYFFRSTSPTTSKTSGEQKDAKASSGDRDEGTSQPSPRWE